VSEAVVLWTVVAVVVVIIVVLWYCGTVVL
jgi:hypothetical protein